MKYLWIAAGMILLSICLYFVVEIEKNEPVGASRETLHEGEVVDHPVQGQKQTAGGAVQTSSRKEGVSSLPSEISVSSIGKYSNEVLHDVLEKSKIIPDRRLAAFELATRGVLEAIPAIEDYILDGYSNEKLEKMEGHTRDVDLLSRNMGLDSLIILYDKANKGEQFRIESFCRRILLGNYHFNMKRKAADCLKKILSREDYMILLDKIPERERSAILRIQSLRGTLPIDN